MPLYALILWLVIGGVAGWLAQRILGKVGPFGLIGDIVIGIVGAIIGGYILGLLGASGGGGIFVSFLTALVGALLTNGEGAPLETDVLRTLPPAPQIA